jgi:hypothetical protein
VLRGAAPGHRLRRCSRLSMLAASSSLGPCTIDVPSTAYNDTATEAAAVCFLQYCTPLYVSTVIARSRLGVLCCSAAELAEACLLASSTSANQEQLAAPLLGNSLALAAFPAWTADQRPASAMQQLHIPMQIDLQQLQLMVEAATSDAHEPGKTAQCKPYCWRGLVFRSGLQVCLQQRLP